MRAATMEKDFKVVGNQLGRRPRDLLAVVKRCYKNRPKVIATSPILEDGSPFPTVFWLTCPVLVKKVAQLEGQGWIERLQALVEKDEGLARRLLEAQRDYSGLRRRLIFSREISARRRPDLPAGQAAVLEKGVAGVKDLLKIKCLHAHYAHYLATGTNPVGELIHEKIGEDNPACGGECEVS